MARSSFWGVFPALLLVVGAFLSRASDAALRTRSGSEGRRAREAIHGLLGRGESRAAACEALSWLGTAEPTDLVRTGEPEADSLLLDALLSLVVAGDRCGDPTPRHVWATRALEAYRSATEDLALDLTWRIPAAKNAAWLEATADGASERWGNFDRAYALSQTAQNLHAKLLERALAAEGAGAPRVVPPLSVYDVGLVGSLCAYPSLRPGPVRCGDRHSRLESTSGSGSAVAAAQEAGLGMSGGSTPANLYLDLMKRAVANYLYSDLTGDFRSIVTENIPGVTCEDARGMACQAPWGPSYRGYGLSSVTDQSAADCHTTLSGASLTHVQLLVDGVLARGVPGDLIECGVFRGGTTIFMRAALAARGVTDRRVYVADSFAGIPPSRRTPEGQDQEECDDWEERYAVSQETVESNFQRYGLLDDQVHFLPGFFNISLPPVFGTAGAPLPPSAPTLALVRIDADAYDGVRDALESLYPRLAVGGSVIIDDFHLTGAVSATHEYRRRHGIDDPIFIVPSDYVYTCSVPESDLESLQHCHAPRTSIYIVNKFLITGLLPHVAYWTKTREVAF